VADRYDAVVIGAGPAGEVCAGELSDGGMKVAIVERELVAGECSYWACIPTKTLLRPGEAVWQAREAPGAKEAITGPIDSQAAFGWRNFMTSDWTDDGQVAWLDSMKIDLHRGEGRIDGKGRVVVGDQTLEADRIVVATGSSPAIPPIDGLDQAEGVWTNREATEMQELPESVVILGAGPVGTELSQILHRFGAQVTLIEGMSQPLSRENKAAGLALEDALRAEGIDVRCGTRASKVSQGDGSYAVELEDGDSVTAQKLLVATGRKPNVTGIGLETAGVTFDERDGIEVDDQLRAGDGVWAIGDPTGVALFTHVGKYQARVCAAAMLGKDARADYRAIPRVVFTDPQVAAVGEIEGAQTGTAQLSGVARTSTYTRQYAEKPGFLTLVSDGQKLTGAYAVGPEAGEWLGQATLAVKAEVPLDVLRDTIQPFPSFSEAFMNALHDSRRSPRRS
jgi:pyruvate/2-oxoglutarate dehydrogenase complex dihydrolipoamide dehydrogenase (E3) component